ncbi:MAG: S-adenosylmethionine-binding protein [Trueperaceae bacterium]|nr:S-adenosylmethionine-binding protein [Trueperaceae bacterium]
MSEYRTIVADPPWRYTQTPTDRTGGGASAEHQYRTMRTEDIAAIPVREWVGDDAHLYLWVTNPMMLRVRPGISGTATPLDIVTAWGFEPQTLLTWHKLGPIGLGFYFRGETEHVIFATRGKAGIAPAIRERNHIAAPKGAHSVKPDRFYEMVERVSPEPRLELFARRRRYGWDVWGDEAPEYAASQAEMGLDLLIGGSAAAAAE